MTNNASEIVVPWSGRGQQYTQDEIDAVVEAMQNADPLTQGRYKKEFQEKFASYTGANHAFAMSSCTAALEISALLSRIGDGDEVVIPSHTFAASAIPFARTGAKLVWADVGPDTWVVTAETLEKAMTPATKVFVVVHLYGLMCDMDPIMELAAKHNILVVEDAAQSIGASYKGKRAGSIGDFGCFSFHTHKNVSTLGEGGILTVKDAEHAKLVDGLHHNGMRPYTHERDHYWQPAMSNVDFDIDGLWPYNFCIGEPQCALGTKLVDRIDTINSERGERAKRFHAALKDYPELVFQAQPEGCGHTHHLMPARYDGSKYGKTRDDLMKALVYSHGVKAVVQYYPLDRYPMFEKAGFGEANCPNADHFFDNMVSLPFQHWMDEKTFNELVARTKAALDDLRKG